MADPDLRALLVALDDRELVLSLAILPVGRLMDPEQCHIHEFYREVSRYEHLRQDQQEAVQAIFDWHNIRIDSGRIHDEGYFRCLAIYGAAAEFLLDEAASAADEGSPA